MSSSAVDSRPQQRPRTFSFRSHKSGKSHKSHGSHTNDHEHKLHHQRTSSKDEHKQHLGGTTKADPNAAMNEVQPIAAALEKPTLQSLRSFQHTDSNGNPIAEPDLSNPTRSRWERPLDTIRSFEAAIDGEYRRRSMATRGDAPSEAMSGFNSRRNSYYNGGQDQGRFQGANGGFYGNRNGPPARDSWVDGYGPGAGPRGTRYNRSQSQNDAGWNRQSNGHGVYPTPGYQQSRDTVNTGGSYGSHSEPYASDPSSENSSIERGGPVRAPDLGEQYGFSGFGQGPQPILEEYGNGHGLPSSSYPPQQYPQVNGPPPVPTKMSGPPASNSRNVINLSNSQGGAPAAGNSKPNLLSRKSTNGEEKKRQSWLKKRFSKH